MSDILSDINNTMKEIETGIRNIMMGQELYILLNRASMEIERLRKANIDMGWELNPDRSGGQFDYWEQKKDEWL